MINTLFGDNVAKVGHNLSRETIKVQEHYKKFNGIPLIILDSPGLQDGHEEEMTYMKDMVNKSQKLDLVFYTAKMDSKRIEQDDLRAMEKLHDAFGIEFWNKTMIVLTFANRIKDDTIMPGMTDFDKEEIYFNKCLKKWQERLPKDLQNLSVTAEIAHRIPVVPAGLIWTDLPGYKNWFANFWMSTLNYLKESGPNSNFLLQFRNNQSNSTQESHEEENIDKPEQRSILNIITFGWFG